MGTVKKDKNRHGDTSSDTAVSLKKGDFNTPSVNPFFQKENGGLKYNISKPPFCAARSITTVLLCVSTDAIKRKEPIIRMPAGYGLSALRLCVWLFDNGYIELFYMDQGFLPTFRTE